MVPKVVTSRTGPSDKLLRLTSMRRALFWSRAADYSGEYGLYGVVHREHGVYGRIKLSPGRSRRANSRGGCLLGAACGSWPCCHSYPVEMSFFWPWMAAPVVYQAALRTRPSTTRCEGVWRRGMSLGDFVCAWSITKVYAGYGRKRVKP